MPPDADQLRQRKVFLNHHNEDDYESSSSFHEDHHMDEYERDATQAQPSFRIVKHLNDLQPNEVCIDGRIYDLTTFRHPGGDQILLFGGNDVTIQYKMIHPHHTSSNNGTNGVNKHLEKMQCVGQVANYQSEYQFGTPFEREVKTRVFQIVRRGREFGTRGYFFRAFLYIALFVYLQYLWVFHGSTATLAIIYGLSQSLIGMNVQHDANHGACSKQPWINDVLGFGADLIGGCKWLWQIQHWTHHAYTNHADLDPDALGAEPMLLFNDYPLGHSARQWYHAFQFLFYIPVLAGYWLSSVFNPQILDLRQRGAQHVGIHMDSPYIVHRRKYAILLRLLYIYVNAVTPFLHHHGLCWRALRDVLLLGIADSLGLAVLFSLSHNFVDADRDPTKPARMSTTTTTTMTTTTGTTTTTTTTTASPPNGEPQNQLLQPQSQQSPPQPVCWFKSQVETSCTYGGFVSGCLTGGLNFQIEHHLFPRMSSAWYPYIAPVVREVCAQHNVRYVYYPYVHQNLFSTLQYLYRVGSGVNWKHHHESNPLSGSL